MHTLATRFDPIDYARQLRGAGVSQEQADIQAQTIEKVINDIANNQDLATKQDLLVIKNDILLTKQELQLEIERLRNELIKWMLGIGVGGILAIAGLLKFMIH